MDTRLKLRSFQEVAAVDWQGLNLLRRDYALYRRLLRIYLHACSFDCHLLLRASAECPVGGRSGGKDAHLLLQLDKEHLRRLISVRCLETLEIVRQLVARKLLLDFGARPDLALVRFDLLLHARERLEC